MTAASGCDNPPKSRASATDPELTGHSQKGKSNSGYFFAPGGGKQIHSANTPQSARRPPPYPVVSGGRSAQPDLPVRRCQTPGRRAPARFPPGSHKEEWPRRASVRTSCPDGQGCIASPVGQYVPVLSDRSAKISA